MLEIGYQPWGETLDELVAAARAAEEAGAGVIWLPELHRSANITAAAVGAGTSRATVATGVAAAFARSPMTTALEALDLDDVTRGRFRLGLGSGTRRMNTEWHGVEFDQPVERMDETVTAIRTFWRDAAAGGRIESGGRLRPMRIAGYRRPFATRQRPIPVHLGGVGPRMIRLAGRIADGWLAHELCTPEYVRAQVLPELERGLDAAERTRGSLEVTASAVCAVTDEHKEASELLTGHVGFYAGVGAYADFFAFHGVADEHERVAAAMRSGSRSDTLRASARMRDVMAVAGSRAEVGARILEYEQVADAVKLSPPVHGLEPEKIRVAQRNLIGLIAVLRG